MLPPVELISGGGREMGNVVKNKMALGESLHCERAMGAEVPDEVFEEEVV